MTVHVEVGATLLARETSSIEDKRGSEMLAGIFGALRSKGRGEGMPADDIRYVPGEVNDRFSHYVRHREFRQKRKVLLRRDTRVFPLAHASQMRSEIS